MTATYRYRIICECGRDGNIVFRESGSTYGGLGEQYSLDGFEGGSLTVTSERADPPEAMLAALDPKCPECGQKGKVQRA